MFPSPQYLVIKNNLWKKRHRCDFVGEIRRVIFSTSCCTCATYFESNTGFFFTQFLARGPSELHVAHTVHPLLRWSRRWCAPQTKSFEIFERTLWFKAKQEKLGHAWKVYPGTFATTTTTQTQQQQQQARARARARAGAGARARAPARATTNNQQPIHRLSNRQPEDWKAT